MTKAVQAFLAGIFFTFILDFFFFLGIQLHYIDHYEIDVVYNLLFADHQSLILYLIMTAVLGYLTIYFEHPRKVAITLAVLFGLVLLTLVPPIGNMFGKMLLMKTDQTLYDSRYRYQGDVYYDGRDALGDRAVWIWDKEEERMFKLMKRDLKQ